MFGVGLTEQILDDWRKDLWGPCFREARGDLGKQLLCYIKLIIPFILVVIAVIVAAIVDLIAAVVRLITDVAKEVAGRSWLGGVRRRFSDAGRPIPGHPAA